jgi:ABC-type metal ion transport system substrate-binding protein
MSRERELDIKMHVEANYIAKALAESDAALISDNIALEEALVNSILFHDLYQAILEKARYIRYGEEE